MAHVERDFWGSPFGNDYLYDPGGQNLGHSSSSPAVPWKSAETYLGLQANVSPDTLTTGINVGTSDWVTTVLHLQFDNITDDGDFVIFEIRDGSSLLMRFKLTSTGGDITVYDANGSSITTFSGLVAIDTNYWLAIKHKVSNSSDLRIWWGAAGSPLGAGQLLLDTTGVDLDAGGSGTAYRVAWVNDSNQAYGINVYPGSGLLRTDSGATITTNDTLPQPFWTRTYKWNNATATPDWGAVALDVGTWNNLRESPENTSNLGTYTGNADDTGGMTCDDATLGGPKGDSLITGTLLWVAWVWTYRCRSTQFGTDFPDWQGKYGSGATASTAPSGATSVRDGIGGNPGSWQLEVVKQASGGAQFPDPSTDWMQIGFRHLSGDSAADVSVADCWCVVLHEEPAQAVTPERKIPRGVRRGLLRGVA